MARIKTVVMVCDITGEQDDQATTRTISLDGVTGEIDLCAGKSDELDKILAPFIAVARKTKR